MAQSSTSAGYPVMFRTVKSGPHKGTVDAIFIAECDSYFERDSVMCYSHIGQHSGATLDYVHSMTRPATPDEFARLKRELESIGYELQLVDRDSPKFQAARSAQLKAARESWRQDPISGPWNAGEARP